MYCISHRSPSLAWAALITFVAGCASPPPDVRVVAKTLATYQVGKTTFADFKKDAGLFMKEPPAPSVPAQKSYLNPQSPTFDQLKTQKVYAVPEGRPWKIYETGNTFTLNHGKYSETHKFVVGDVNKPISILAFDREVNLISIAPIR